MKKKSQKLTDEQVLEIFRQYHAGYPVYLIAKQFSVDRTLIYMIGKRQIHKKVTGGIK
jgi:hypothetical protein